jgi:hypothetical protein
MLRLQRLNKQLSPLNLFHSFDAVYYNESNIAFLTDLESILS